MSHPCYVIRMTIPYPMNEQARKLVHLVFGVAIAAVILILPREEAIMLFSGSLLVGLVLTDLVKAGHRVPLVTLLVMHLEREGEFPGKGAICFVVSSLFCTVFFPSLVAATGVLTLAVLDSASALVGMHYGRKRLNGKKTLEGFLAGVIINSLVLLLLLDPVRAFLVSLVAGTVELAIPLDDNLLVPPAACLCLSLLGA